MARDTASKWIIGVMIYFVLFAAFLLVVNSFKTEYDITDDNYTSTGGSTALQVTSTCGNPRFGDDTRSAYDVTPYFLLKKGYITDNTTCTNYEGFDWVEDTFFFFWGTGTYTCEGRLNTTYYNDGTDFNVSNLFRTKIINKPLYELSQLSSSKRVCEEFGFTWQDSTQLSTDFEVSGIRSAWSVVKDAVTLRINFFSGSSLLNGLLTFLLIWVPIIILIISVYVMLR